MSVRTSALEHFPGYFHQDGLGEHDTVVWADSLEDFGDIEWTIGLDYLANRRFYLYPAHVVPCAVCGQDVYLDDNRKYVIKDKHREVDGVFFCSSNCASRMRGKWVMQVKRTDGLAPVWVGVNFTPEYDTEKYDYYMTADTIFKHAEYNQHEGYYMFSISSIMNLLPNAIAINVICNNE